MAKRIRIALIAAAMTLLLAMGAAAVNVHAADGDTATTTKPTSPTVNKSVKVAEGLTLPNTTFTFTATQVENADKTTAPAQVNLNDVTVSYNGETSTSNLAKSVAFNLSGITLPGEYTYEVAETNGGADHWTYSTQKYYMQVLVKTDGTKSYTITKTKGDTAAANKETGFDFTNAYNKDASLTVTKAVVNPEYEADADYTFTITFTKGANANEVPDLTQVEGNSGLTKNNDGTYTFSLKNKGSITINGIPAGTKYTISEATPSSKNYDGTKIEQTVNGSDTKVTTEALATTKAQVIGEGQNVAAYTNTYKKVTPTGVIMQIAPFIAMVAIAGGAVALYLVSRKRREA